MNSFNQGVPTVDGNFAARDARMQLGCKTHNVCASRRHPDGPAGSLAQKTTGIRLYRLAKRLISNTGLPII